MSLFITSDDYKTYIRDINLSRLIESDTTILDQTEQTAIATVKNSLRPYYDVDVVFAQTGSARSPIVVRYCIVIALYYLYERLPATIMPDRVRDNYKETQAWLTEIEKGEKPIDLPLRPHDPDKPDFTKFRYGSAAAPRTHTL